MLICEFMSQGTLAHKLARGPLVCAEALSLGVALAEALYVIHATGLLHRDIKPSNIGYAADGVPKLLDFGLVHILTPTPAASPSTGEVRTTGSDTAALVNLSVTQPLIGTPLYLSPEAICGHRPTVAFDLWSLNVLLCEAVTGEHPFHQASLRGTLECIAAADSSRTLQGARAIPAAVKAYLERALAKDPGIRPKTALEVADHLRALAAQL
jgi:serine/threonine protein kinase